MPAIRDLCLARADAVARGLVLLGIVAGDPESYLAVEPEWRPTLPTRGATFGLADLLVPG